MKIRLWGTARECEEAAEMLAEITGNGEETRWAVYALRAEYPTAHGQAESPAAAKQQAETALRAAQ